MIQERWERDKSGGFSIISEFGSIDGEFWLIDNLSKKSRSSSDIISSNNYISHRFDLSISYASPFFTLPFLRLALFELRHIYPWLFP